MYFFLANDDDNDLRSTSAYMIVRTTRLGSGTIARFPLPPDDADDACVSQQTDGEYDTDEAVPMSTEPQPAPTPRRTCLRAVCHGQATAAQLPLPLRRDACYQVEWLRRLLLLLLVMTMLCRRLNGMAPHHFNNPKRTSTAVVNRLEYLQ